MTVARSQLLAALALVVLGCGADHPPPDDGATAAIDAGRDAGVDDAFCPDGDGDGARDAACGGDDCDDADPAVGPGRGLCIGPVTLRSCVDGVRVDADCSAATPDCDARTNSCETSACGDLVVQPDEQCDGTSGCLRTCERYCFGDADCAGAASVCVPSATDAAGICGVPNPTGLPLGASCASDTQCYSTYCSPESGRCSAGCVNANPCPSDACWCDFTEVYLFSPGATGMHNIYRMNWHFSCERESDCTDGRHCTLVAASPGLTPDYMLLVAATCLPTLVAGGLPIGGDCGSPSAMFTPCESNTCVDGVCTVPCVVDADCPASLPHCLDHVFPMTGLLGVQLWPAPRICSR